MGGGRGTAVARGTNSAKQREEEPHLPRASIGAHDGGYCVEGSERKWEPASMKRGASHSESSLSSEGDPPKAFFKTTS